MIIAICWSAAGRPIQRLPLPLAKEDVHFFDVETFPEFKGQGLAPMFINSLLKRVRCQGFSRAYIDSKVWNTSSLAFIKKTYFHKLGTARTFYIFGRHVAIWSGMFQNGGF